MKAVFEDAGLDYELPGKYRLHVDSEGIRYESANGKKSLNIRFAELASLFLLGYCNSNRNYTVTFRNAEGKAIGEINTDVRDVGHQYDNIRETKSILIAFAESRLGKAFPDNIEQLDLGLAVSLKEKEIRLKAGSLVGAKHQVKLSDIRRVKCVGNGVLNSLLVFTKEKGGFFDLPDMRVPVNELTLPVLEAVMARNTGRGIDFSQGNGFDQKTSDYILERYMNSTFFMNEDGSVSDDWHRIAYEHIAAHQEDITLLE